VRRIADSGFSTLLMPDVQQWQPAPGPTLAVAATLADLRVGTWVYASPLRTPWSMAWEAHSLSVLTEGRFEMGIGTGRPGIEDELRQLGLPVVAPCERLSQVRDAVTSLSLDASSSTFFAAGVMRRRSFFAMSLIVGFFGTARIGSAGASVLDPRPRALRAS
jgi:alkanesulfonate monooxygenase SsuD/methylene tetrahydromethanopterin reductase-like flavin-dependent oxidoreductase (luciferase family)